jgi:hypothetical protein
MPSAGQPAEQPQASRPGEQPSTPQQPQPPSQAQQPEQGQQPEQPEAPGAGAETGTGAEAGAAAEAAAGAGAGGEAGAGGAGGEAGLGGGTAESSGGFLGRGDANNRFNIFDNMSAVPQNRVWYSYEYMQGFNTGVQPNPSNSFVTNGFAPRRNETLYRMGAEIVPCCGCFGPNVSLAFQTEYIASAGTSDKADAWGDPQGLIKWEVCHSDCSAFSLIFGMQFQTASHDGELHEKSTYFYPGFLFYESLTQRLFVQGGFQVAVSNRNDPNTVDGAFSVGYWLYGCPPAAGAPRMWSHCGPCITGIIPQFELYGAHVVANSTRDPFELQGNPLDPTSSAPYREPKNVYDMTVGGQIVFHNKIYWGTAYSFPVSGPSIRKAELLTNLSFYF